MTARTASDHGITLVEVLCALLLVATAATGVARLGVVAFGAIAGARQETVATTLATEKMEQLLSLAWSPSAADLATDLSVTPLSGGGRGLAASPPGALTANTPGCVDFLDASGAVVGSGGIVAPAGAAYVRRWRVAPAAFGGGRAVAIQVFVTLAANPTPLLVAARAKSAGDALLSTVRVRRAL